MAKIYELDIGNYSTLFIEPYWQTYLENLDSITQFVYKSE